MKVRVFRKSGDKEYPEVIVDELCTEESVGKAKGMTFLYDSMSKMVYDVETRYDGLLNPNDVILLDDTSIGESFYGRIKNINISGSRDQEALVIDQNITIERYLDE